MWCALICFLSLALSVFLACWQLRAGVLHLAGFVFTLLLILTLSTSLVGTAGGLWRAFRGPRRRVAAAWGLACFLPLVLWVGLAVFTLHATAIGQALPKNTVTDIVSVAIASIMEDQARLAYPHRL